MVIPIRIEIKGFVQAAGEEAAVPALKGEEIGIIILVIIITGDRVVTIKAIIIITEIIILNRNSKVINPNMVVSPTEMIDVPIVKIEDPIKRTLEAREKSKDRHKWVTV